MFEEQSSKTRGVFRTQASIYDGVFVDILNLLFLQQNSRHTCSIGLYIGHQNYWDFQSEVKVEQIIAIVTTRSVFCCSYFHFRLMLCFLIFSKTKFLTRSLIYVHRFGVSQSTNGSNDTINRKFYCFYCLSSFIVISIFF